MTRKKNVLRILKLFVLLFLINLLNTLTSAAELFEIASGHSMQKIRRDGIGLDQLNYNRGIYIDAAKDESESFQLVVIPQGKAIKSVMVTAEPLTSLDGSNMPLKWHIVSYVKTGNPSYPVDYVGWWPDPLLPAEKFDVAADMVQPLWFTISVPSDAKAGIYRGNVTIDADGCRKQIPVTLRVRNFTIPRPGTLATPFGLYLHVLNGWYYGKEGSMKKDDYAKWCKFLTDYRLTPKNIGSEYIKKEYKNIDGENKLVGVDMSAQSETIKELSNNYFAPYSYDLYRLPCGPSVKKELEENSSDYTPQKIAEPVKIYFDEWEKQGFSDKVYIYGVDEAAGEEVFEFVGKTYELIKEAIPSCKIMQTGNCNVPRLAGLVDIWCPKTTISREPFFQERQRAGDTLWTYVCCSPVPPSANLLVDEPAIDHRILFWQTRQIKAVGFLYWTVIWYEGLEPNAHSGKPCFPDVPIDFSQSPLLTDAWVHVNGDGLLVYPGKNLTPLPSIRLEVVRDGIEDYEYMVILEKLTEQVCQLKQYQTEGTKSLIAQAKELASVPNFITSDVEVFTKDPQVIFKRRTMIADMIEQLVDVLNQKAYEKWKN